MGRNATFHFCPSFALLHEILFASAAHLLADKWLSASYHRNIDWILNGVAAIHFKHNVHLFHSVQSFISQSNRFLTIILICCLLLLFSLVVLLFFVFVVIF